MQDANSNNEMYDENLHENPHNNSADQDLDEHLQQPHESIHMELHSQQPHLMPVEKQQQPSAQVMQPLAINQPSEGTAEVCNFDSHIILMKGITWARDSHGLFDYESRHLTKKTMKTESEIIIMRHGNELSTSNYSRSLPFEDQVNAMTQEAEDKALLKIVNHGDQTFYLESASCNLKNEEDMRLPGQPAIGLSNLNENMYLVVRSLKHNNEKIDYEIQEKDILKIGRVKFAVKKIGYANDMEVDKPAEKPVSIEMERGHSANSVLDKPNDELFEEFEEIEEAIMEADQNEEEVENKCRFCWMTHASPENPLLKCCRCAGSVGCIHLECLKSWLEVKRQSKESPNFSSFFWKTFECEICKKAYPLMIKTGSHKFKLVDYQNQKGDYMVLESLNQEKNTSRIIHIIRPTAQKDVFKLGRGHESDLRINDISVSRCHAKIKLENGKFMLEDNQSKFGTLVLVKQRTPLLPGYNKAVQVGRTVINFSVKATSHSGTGGQPNANKHNALEQVALDDVDEQQQQPKQPALQTQVTKVPTDVPVLPQIVHNFQPGTIAEHQQTGSNWNAQDDEYQLQLALLQSQQLANQQNQQQDPPGDQQ